MTIFIKRTVLAAAVVLLGVTGAGLVHAATTDKAEKVPATPWVQRCEKDSKYCEVFQQLSIKEKGAKEAKRLIEFAIGFPADKKGQARGVFILPLGILLSQDTSVAVDGKAAFTFRVRYCDAGGCIAVLDLPDATLATIRKGKQMTVNLIAQNGQKIDVNMELNGFSPALDKIKS